MSSPISIPRISASSSSSGSESGSYTSSSPASSYIANSVASSPSKGLYVPVHKRSPSSGSPTSTLVPLPTTTTPHPRIYSLQLLLSLRPNAEDVMKEKIRAGPAPELLMNRRMRKNLEFAEHQHRRVSPTRSPAPAAEVAAPTPTPAQPPAQKMPHSPRLAPRRNRFGPRASERRKQVLQTSLDSWRHDTALHLPATPRLVV